MDLHGGTIAAASGGKGKGATFTVELPAGPGTATSGQNDAKLPPLACSVLLVEDHADSRKSITRLLTHLGCKVAVAGTVAEALATVERQNFDLLISDIGLPDASGAELMRQVKAQHGLKGIALSGYGMEQDVAQSTEAGFEAHLTKPINVHVLEATVRQLAEQK